jgi:hypothetical protein
MTGLKAKIGARLLAGACAEAYSIDAKGGIAHGW